jgi:hypothetical protein
MPRQMPLVALVALVLAGCASVASPSPAPSLSVGSQPPRPTPLPTATPTPPPTDGTVATAPVQAIPDQSETAWGRIWDELPVGFPLSGIGRLDQIDPHEGVSGAYDVAATVDEVAPAMQAALESATFSTLSMSGPFEDGTVVIESVGPDTTECRVETRIAPHVGGSRLTVLYGAACPFPLE